jgi:hypothetical protein
VAVPERVAGRCRCPRTGRAHAAGSRSRPSGRGSRRRTARPARTYPRPLPART